MRQDEKIVREFMQAWNGDFRQAFEDYLAEDCVWLNSGFPDLPNKEMCLRLVDGCLSAYSRIDVEFVQVGSNDDVIFVERIDHAFDADGNELVATAIAGVLKVRDDKIVHWADYFDATPFAGLVAELIGSGAFSELASPQPNAH